MDNIITTKTCLLLLVYACLSISLQLPGQTNSVLDNYIRQGLKNNLALNQKKLNLDKSLMALEEANGLFYPSISIESQYYLSKGGRTVNLPVGDMLNPVYSSLNQILTNMDQPANFPQIKNEEIQFLPSNYHDSKARMIIPLVNAEIFYNQKIKKEMINVSQAEVNVYKRELIKEIKIAYFRYLQAVKVVDAYESALSLVKEAKRVNTKLVENQMIGKEKLLRIEAEQSQVVAQLTKAHNDKEIAASYFNFLINSQLQSEIEIDTLITDNDGFIPTNLFTAEKQGREEISQLNSAIKSSDYYFQMKKAWWVPTISNITDFGYQGYSFKFNNDQRYMMNTINLSWQIFNGFQNHSRMSQALIETEKLKNQLTEAEQQIAFQSSMAERNLESSIKAEQANLSSLNSSREYYKVVSKQYAVDQKSLLDLLDARNQYSSAEINYYISHYETLIRKAELERAIAKVDLNFYEK